MTAPLEALRAKIMTSACDYAEAIYHPANGNDLAEQRAVLLSSIDEALAAAIAAQPEPPMCMCKDRPASQCPGEWEPGCDLGNLIAAVRYYAVPKAEPSDEQKLAQAIEGRENIWTCKVGGKITGLPKGADGPMRRAVQDMFARLTGYEPEFCFSGWAGSLEECERAVVENREPLYASPPAAAPLTDEAGLPPKYMLAKLQMVMPLFQEARDALPAISIVAAKLHHVDLSLGDRMDRAGTFSLDDWNRAHGIGSAPTDQLKG